MKIDLYPIRYSKLELGQTSRGHILVYLRFGQVGNEIRLLRQQLLTATNALDDGEPYNRAAVGWAQLALRMLALRLHESQTLLARDDATEVLSLGGAELVGRATDARVAVTSYFSRPDNAITRVRKKLAGHFDLKTFWMAYDGLADDEPLVDYLAHHVGNTIYGSADSVMTKAMIDLAAEVDETPADTYDRLFREIMDVSSSIEDFVLCVHEAFVFRYLRNKSPGLRDAAISVNADDISEARPRMFLSSL